MESFAHPGGNITGLAWLLRDISAKRVELLKELLPKLSSVGVLWDADGPGPAIAVKEYEAAARAFKIELRSLAIRGPNPDFAGAFQTAKTVRLDALIVVANPLMAQHAKEVFELAAKYRLPSMTEEGRFVRAGGLMSYGASLGDLYRRSAGYVVEILKGAKPADLPVKLAGKIRDLRQPKDGAPPWPCYTTARAGPGRQGDQRMMLTSGTSSPLFHLVGISVINTRVLPTARR